MIQDLFVLEAPWDQDPGLKDTITASWVSLAGSTSASNCSTAFFQEKLSELVPETNVSTHTVITVMMYSGKALPHEKSHLLIEGLRERTE